MNSGALLEPVQGCGRRVDMRTGIDWLFLSILGLALRLLIPSDVGWLVAFPLVYLTLGSYLYQRWGGLPHRLPRCPGCGRRDSHYYRLQYVMDRLTLGCDCGSVFECWFSKPPAEYAPGSCPEFRCVQPRIIGNYLQTWPGHPGPAVEAAFPEESFEVLLVPEGRTEMRELCCSIKVGSEGGKFEAVVNEIFPELTSDGLVNAYHDQDALLLRMTKSNDLATDFGNILCLWRLMRWFAENHPHYVAYCPEEERILKPPDWL